MCANCNRHVPRRPAASPKLYPNRHVDRTGMDLIPWNPLRANFKYDDESPQQSLITLPLHCRLWPLQVPISTSTYWSATSPRLVPWMLLLFRTMDTGSRLWGITWWQQAPARSCSGCCVTLSGWSISCIRMEWLPSSLISDGEHPKAPNPGVLDMPCFA